MLTVLLLLGACTAGPDARMDPVTPPSSGSSDLPAEDAGAAPSALAQLPPPAPPPPKPLPSADILIGKSMTEIEAVFGAPVLRRVDEPAEVWQYLTDACALHLFFYPDADLMRVVSHISMNDRATFAKADGRACFRSQIGRLDKDKAAQLE
jgi:hypothetical protein